MEYRKHLEDGSVLKINRDGGYNCLSWTYGPFTVQYHGARGKIQKAYKQISLTDDFRMFLRKNKRYDLSSDIPKIMEFVKKMEKTRSRAANR